MLRILFTGIICLSATIITAQQLRDTTLSPVVVRGEQDAAQTRPVGEIEGMAIYAAKKSHSISLRHALLDHSAGNMRQLFSKIPGIHIWENDGSGIQTSIASRGLSPNRSWEFNMRQNSVDIASDPFGYPEAYYTPPLEMVQRIDIVRGAGALQFGPQFGGSINYVMKKGNALKPFSFETQTTGGSFGLFNHYSAIGGTKGRIQYYAGVHHRMADGWRANSRYRITTGYAAVAWKATDKTTITFDVTRQQYLSQQPGGLTDSLFKVSNRQSLRSRNWFAIEWNIASVQVDYRLNDRSSIQLKAFGLHGIRSSVGFTKTVNTADSYTSTGFANRQLDKDEYTNAGMELRWLGRWKLGELSAGVKYFRGHTLRRQKGIADRGSDPIFQLSENEDFQARLSYDITNAAAFAEHIFRFGKKFKVVPGIRMENLINNGSGRIALTNGNLPQMHSYRRFILGGIGASYQITQALEINGNISQAYRPVTFADLTPSAVSETIDPKLRDAHGWNADLFIRGNFGKRLALDAGVYQMRYLDRVGTILLNNANFRTNIGDALSRGVDLALDFKILGADDPRKGFLAIQIVSSWNEAYYTSGHEMAKVKVNGKKLENAPRYIHRAGITAGWKFFDIQIQYSEVSGVFTDAANTVKPNAESTVGWINGYRIIDIASRFHLPKNLTLSGGVNNLGNVAYATRRSTGYPGPGLLPGNGRTIFIALSYGL